MISPQVNHTTALSDYTSVDYKNVTNNYSEFFDNETADTMNYCPNVNSPISNLILMSLYLIVCVLGLLGNSLVLFVVIRFRYLE